MVDQKKITDEISVSGQITLDDIIELKNRGVETIICNRPDNEDPGQLNHNNIQQAAESQGMTFHFMPVQSGKVTLADGDSFLSLLNEVPKPIHAYCRSGTRCTTLWALAQLKEGKEKTDVLALAARAGYDLSKTI